MKIDLFKLNNMGEVKVEGLVNIPEYFYDKLPIKRIKELHVTGNIKIDYVDDVICNLTIDGMFILECALTLEDVPYKMDTSIEANIGNFNDLYDKNKNTLDILPIIWENIVSEVPMHVVLKGAKPLKTDGDGWKLVSEE